MQSKQTLPSGAVVRPLVQPSPQSSQKGTNNASNAPAPASVLTKVKTAATRPPATTGPAKTASTSVNPPAPQTNAQAARPVIPHAPKAIATAFPPLFPQTPVRAATKPSTKPAHVSARKRPAPKDDDELEVLSIRVPLHDIVSKKRIAKSVKSIKCTHRQAFDFFSFCQVNKVPSAFFDRAELTTSRYSVDRVPNEKQEAEPKSRSASVEVVTQMFRLKLTNPKVTPNTLKLTKKRKHTFSFRCPVCNTPFDSTELIHDDFMDLVLKSVGETVKEVMIDDNNLVSVIEEKRVFENVQEVIALSDDEEDGPDKKKNKRVKITLFEKDDPYHLSSFEDTDDSEEDNLYINGDTADNPVVLD